MPATSPGKYQIVAIVGQDIVDALDRQARRERSSRSHIVERFLAEHLEELGLLPPRNGSASTSA